MKTNIIFRTFLICLLFTTTSKAQQGWEKLYTNLSANNNQAIGNVVPSDNGGFHTLTNQYGNYGSFALMKIDDNGNPLATVTFGINELHRTSKLIKATNGDLIVLTQIKDLQGDVRIKFMRVTATNYSIISETIIDLGVSYSEAKDIIETAEGDFWLTGRRDDGTTTSYIQKINAQGQAIGAIILDQLEYYYPIKIFTLPNGNFSLIGEGEIDGTGTKAIVNNYDNNGDFISQVVHSEPIGNYIVPSDAVQTADGGFLIMSDSHTGSFLIKTDSAGNELWRKVYDDPNNNGSWVFKKMAVSPNNNGYRLIYGYHDSNYDKYYGIIHIDFAGNIVWQREFPNYYTHNSQDMFVLPDGGTLISGSRNREINVNSSGNALPHIIRTNANGNVFENGVSGFVTSDSNEDCVPDGIELSVGKFMAIYENGVSIAASPVDEQGNYTISGPEGSYDLAVVLPNSSWVSCQDTLNIDIPENNVLENQNFTIAHQPEPIDSIYGYIFYDYDNDCLRDSFETIGYEGWTVTLDIQEGDSFTTVEETTDANGYYSFTNISQFTKEAFIVYSFSYVGTGLTCSNTCQITEVLDLLTTDSAQLDHPVTCDTLPFCPIMSASLATGEIRPCTEGWYNVHYTNIGGATAQDAYLEVSIDSSLTVISSSIPWDAVVDNVYTFNLGDLLSNEHSSFQIGFNAPCDEPTGTTYCSEVYAYPDSTCVPTNPLWDGSEVELSVECQEDNVKFRIQNIGTNDMSQPSEFIVIEDNVLLYSEPQIFQLDAGQVLEIDQPANGSFYYMKAQQPEGFPGLDTPIAWVEGCGDSQMANLGLVNQYPLGDEDSWHDIFCLESTNSYDPNDKNGFPRGLGEQRFIDENEPLEYIIRFQNTGTAEALYVEIRDTLPFDVLDPKTIQVGASSHDYTWDIAGNGVIIFKFENINLPYESADEEGSNGFVQFRINQRADLPAGTIINNTAAIYFDNNSPIITNQTLHTIGEDYLSTWVKNIPSEQLLDVTVYPNPAKDLIQVYVEDLPSGENLRLELYDILGRNVANTIFENNAAVHLKPSAGTYFYKIYHSEQLIGVGKLMKL